MFKQEHIDLSYGFNAVSNSLLDDTPNGDYLLDDSRGITWGVKCFLPNCDTTKRNTPRARFFRFPKHNHELFSRWMVACGYRTLPARYNRYLCHKHFDPSCFGKRRLKTDSIPTLNLPKFLTLKDFRDEEPNTKCELIEAPQLEQMLPEIEVTTEYAEIETPPVECQYSIQKSQYVTQNNYSNYEKQSQIQQNNYSNYEKQSQIQYSDLPDDLSDIPPDENETEEPICCSCIENREKVESFRQKYDALLQKYQNLRKMHEKYQKFYYYNNQHSKDGQNENKVMIQQQIKNQNQNQNRSFNPFSKNNMLNQSVPPLKISLPIKTSTPNQNSIKSEHMNQSMNQNLNPNKSQNLNLNHETTQRKKKSESRKKNSQNHKSSKKPPSQDYNKSQSYYSDTLKRSCTKTVIDYTIADSTTSDDSDESFLPSAQRRRSASKKYKKSNW